MGTQQTDKFWVSGAKWRVRYRPRGTGIFQVSVCDESGSFLDLAANQREPLRGVKGFKGRGCRHLSISCSDVRWTVTVEQYLTVIEEWQLLQLMKQPPPSLYKLGTWTGDAVETEYELVVPSGSWQLTYANTGKGTLQLLVLDEEGAIVSSAPPKAGEHGQGWVHRSGKFVLRVKAVDTSWKVEVLGEQPEEP